MRIFERKRIKPIDLQPGDTLTMTYRDVEGRNHVLLDGKPFSEQTVINEALIIELDDQEAADLRLRAGFGGIFGESS